MVARANIPRANCPHFSNLQIRESLRKCANLFARLESRRITLSLSLYTSAAYSPMKFAARNFVVMESHFSPPQFSTYLRFLADRVGRQSELSRGRKNFSPFVKRDAAGYILMKILRARRIQTLLLCKSSRQSRPIVALFNY